MHFAHNAVVSALESRTRAPSARELARRIAAGELSARDQLEQCIARCEGRLAGLRALVVSRFDEARAEADAIDRAQRVGEPLGPLAGVPLSVKECFHLRGTPATIGVREYAHELATVDSPLVARLRDAGAVVIGKTNVPQLMLSHECSNTHYGRTLNPWDIERSPGGSSGGEAALLAGGGSALGLGSDTGGSIRQPAHCCGLQGFKPTAGRLRLVGVRGNFRGMDAISSQPGPLARHVEDLILAFQLLAEPSEGVAPELRDPYLPPLPWQDPNEVAIEGLRIAVWNDDGFFPAAPAIRRAVDEAAAALAHQGAVVARFDPPKVEQAIQLYLGVMSADGGADLRRTLAEAPCESQVGRLLRLGHLPNWARDPLAAVLSSFGQTRAGFVLASARRLSADGYWQLAAARREYSEMFLEALAAGGFQAFICPPHALPALRHDTFSYLLPAASYTLVPNVVGAPVGVVAATRVRPGEESDRARSRDWTVQAALATERGSAGLPVGVQVGAPLWQDAVVLRVMLALEQHFRAQPDYPRLPLDDA
jgi:fatty acid amide hydrolase